MSPSLEQGTVEGFVKAEDRSSLASEIAAALKTRIIRRRKNKTYAEWNSIRAFCGTEMLVVAQK
jgi:hypothetical protein